MRAYCLADANVDSGTRSSITMTNVWILAGGARLLVIVSVIVMLLLVPE